MTPNSGKAKTPLSSFVSRNLVTIVMIPSIIAIHYGWTLLQQNENLVKKDEQIELPVVTGVKHVWKDIQQKFSFQDDVSKK